MTEPQPRNILFIIVDQLNKNALSFVPTPNLDRLASQSTVFDRHYSCITPCSPARASLFTGLYGFNHRVIHNGDPLPSSIPNLAFELRKLGIEPLLFGYTDIAKDPTDLHPNDPDLKSYEQLLTGFREITEMRFFESFEWLADLNEKGYKLPRPLPQNLLELYRPASPTGKIAEINDPAIYSEKDSDTAFLTNQFLSQMSVRSDNPWFAHLAYIRPHPPFVAPKPYNRMFDLESFPEALSESFSHPFTDLWKQEKLISAPFIGAIDDVRKLTRRQNQQLRSVYLGLIAEIDFHVGRILNWLEETDQMKNTLVVFTSDHGEMMGEFGQWGKESVFDGAFHVPLMIYDPLRKTILGEKNSSQIKTPTESIDLMPTMLEWLGVKKYNQPKTNGRSLLDFVRGTEKSKKHCTISEVSFSKYNKETIYQKKFGLKKKEDAHAFIFRTEKYKYVHFRKILPPMLFDTEQDPQELNNLAEDPGYQNTKLEMKATLFEFIKKNSVSHAELDKKSKNLLL